MASENCGSSFGYVFESDGPQCNDTDDTVNW